MVRELNRVYFRVEDILNDGKRERCLFVGGVVRPTLSHNSGTPGLILEPGSFI